MKKQDLLIEVYSQDTPAVAVLCGVDMTKLPDLKSLITVALMDHYDLDDVTCDDIPEWVASQSFPKFSVEYKLTDGDAHYAETAHITPIPVYSIYH